MISHKHYLDFLFKTGLTQAEFIFIFLVYKKDTNYINRYKERFPTEDGTMIGKYNTNRLIEDGWIKQEGDEYVAADKFRRLFISDSNGFDELVEYYPKYYETDKGVKMPLVLADKFQYSLKYGGMINNSIAEHNEIIKDIEYGAEHNLINFKIEKFIDSQFWNVLREKRLGDTTNNIHEEHTFG